MVTLVVLVYLTTVGLTTVLASFGVPARAAEGNLVLVIAADIAARCSVAGTTDCDTLDLLILKKAMDAAAASVPTRCDAALSPATASP